MKNQRLWKFCLVSAIGIVTLFWIIDLITVQTEENMSFIHVDYRDQINLWGLEAERLYLAGDEKAIEEWLQNIRETEKTWVSIVQTNIKRLAGDPLPDDYSSGHTLGRDVNWKIHLYFEENPIMEVGFSNSQASFLIKLPQYMRPGSYFDQAWFSLKIILPIIVLALLSIYLYQHIMKPLQQLKLATRSFSQGSFDVRVRMLLGNRNDELSELAETFDQMASRIGEQLISQRQLISDLSHELRTPLTRLDISIQSLQDGQEEQANLERIQRESENIRKLVDDSLTLAWLENEQPLLNEESLDIVDLLDVLISDAQFEFQDRNLKVDMPETAEIHNSSHRSLAQALENIIRNALRYTPCDETVSITVHGQNDYWNIIIRDEGPGLPPQYLEAIFQPFFRLDSSSLSSNSNFGLGLTLARRQIMAVRGTVTATNARTGGLIMHIKLPMR